MSKAIASVLLLHFFLDVTIAVATFVTTACMTAKVQLQILFLGRTNLSLALGNMVVARQILLLLNLSYLPCSVQFVNKNYCHAKKTIFLRPVDAIILRVNDVL